MCILRCQAVSANIRFTDPIDLINPGRIDDLIMIPDSKVHGANMGPIWRRQDPGGPVLVPWALLSGMLLCIVS